MSTKSRRSAEDSTAGMGMGATNTLDRVAASVGLLQEVQIEFQPALDITYGGVLFALPALLVCGLLRHTKKHFQLPKGYYGLKSIFLLLAFMALARLKSAEQLRYCAPGEWGKILGLDRVPEVRTLRGKIAHLSSHESSMEWSTDLCRDWMSADEASAVSFYVDGHVRVYHGHQTRLPRHYVARQKLCLRATTDYWVNAMDGQPFFLLNKAVDPGLLKVLEEEIIPRLEQDVPHQPTEQVLADHPLLHRFAIIFDREGYSPQFMHRMKQRRIACVTYHKYPGEDWPAEEFVIRRVKLVSGQEVEMKLAERGVLLGRLIWVREIRKLTDSGHQTSILTTDYHSDLSPVAAVMFARWSQENFFGYMRQHYGLDRLVDHATEKIPDTTRVVNPEYRRLDGMVRSQTGIFNRMLTKFGAMNLEDEIDPKKVDSYQQKKAELLEEINGLQREIERLKNERKGVPHHITISELPQENRFQRLSTHSKHLIDTIKMVAYRAETAMAHVLREKMSRQDDARSLLRAIYRAEADIVPNKQDKTLTVRLHHLANRSTDEAVSYLCDELNATNTVFPGTDLRLIYELVSSKNPGGQEV